MSMEARILDLPDLRSRHGFTLVELLVVVAIITLLIALLVPALAQAKNQAIVTKCLANQRSIVFLCKEYAQDQNECLPAWDNGFNFTTPQWSDNALNTSYEGAMPQLIAWAAGTPNSFPAFLNVPKCFFCPADLDPADIQSTTGNHNDKSTSYDFNVQVWYAAAAENPSGQWQGFNSGNADFHANRAIKVSNVQRCNAWGSTNETDIGLVLETVDGAGADPNLCLQSSYDNILTQLNTGLTAFGYGTVFNIDIIMRHNNFKGATVGFLDGHAESCPDYNRYASTFPSVSNYPNTNPTKLNFWGH